MLNSHKQQTVSGFLIDPSKQAQAIKVGRRDFLDQHKKVSYSGPLVRGAGWTKAGKDLDNPQVVQARTSLSTMSGLVATRTSLPEGHQEKPCTSQPEVVKPVGRFQGSLNGLESNTKQDQNGQTQKMANHSPQAGGGKSSREPYLVSFLTLFSDLNVLNSEQHSLKLLQMF